MFRGMSAIAQYTKGLTEQHKRFVTFVVSGHPIQAAGRLAGYGETGGYPLAKRPEIAAAIHAGIMAALVTEDAPASLRVLRSIRDDEKAPPKVRSDIALRMLGLAGVAPPTKGERGETKALADMTPGELRAYVDRNQAEVEKLEAEIVSRAKDVSAPHSAPIQPATDAKLLKALE